MTADKDRELFHAETLSVALTVRDLATSVAWYCDVPGFGPGRRFEREEVLIAARLNAGQVVILLTQDDGAKGSDRVKGDGLSLNFTTRQDIDAIAALARELGATLATEPGDTPWGTRIMRLQDPDGFKLTISSGIV